MTFEQLQSLIEQTMIGLAETRTITDQNAKDIRETRSIANSNARAIEAIAQQMAMDRDERNTVLEFIARQQKQLDRHQRILKGLQTENRRILDLLINNQPESDD
jgi:aspartate oxidase